MIIDTNVLIYDTFEDFEKHEEARKILDSLPEWFIPSIVLIEFVAFLNKSKLKKEQILDKIEELMKNPKVSLVRVEREDVLEAIKKVRKEDLSTLRINDKIILSIAQRLDKNLITFDKRLKAQFLSQK